MQLAFPRTWFIQYCTSEITDKNWTESQKHIYVCVRTLIYHWNLHILQEQNCDDEDKILSTLFGPYHSTTGVSIFSGSIIYIYVIRLLIQFL